MTVPFDGFSVSSNIPHLSDQMVAHTKELDNALDDLVAQLKPMTDTWTGDGARAYTDLQRRWNALTEQMALNFRKAQTTLSQSYDNYQRTDNNISAKFGGI